MAKAADSWRQAARIVILARDTSFCARHGTNGTGCATAGTNLADHVTWARAVSGIIRWTIFQQTNRNRMVLISSTRPRALNRFQVVQIKTGERTYMQFTDAELKEIADI
jgi:hypothetical protein